MDFFIKTEESHRVIRLLGVTAKRNTTDIEGRVLIEANDDGTVVFSANDRITSISVLSKDAEVISPGKIVIPFDKMRSFVTSFHPWNGDFGTEKLHFVFDNSKMEILVETKHESGRKSKGNIRLDYFDPDVFIKPKEFERTDFILNSNMFKKSVTKVIYAINKNEIRTFIQGMNLRFEKDNLFFAGTNGMLLSEYKVKNSNKLKNESLTLHYEFVSGLKRALGEETQIFFEIDERNIIAKFDDVCFYGRLITGVNYPDYRDQFDNYKHKIIVAKDLLINSLAPFTEILDSDDNNRLSFKILDNKIILSTDDAKFDCDFDVEYNEEFVIDVNGAFMYQTVEAIEDDQILVKFSDDKGCMIFDSGNFEDQKGLISPIRRRA